MLSLSIPAATLGECGEFQDPNQHYEAKNVVITPLRITILNDQTYKISFGCNYWRSCQNKGCSYCQAEMDYSMSSSTSGMMLA